MEMEFHAQQRSNGMSLIYTAGAAAADIQFLQTDDIGFYGCDDLGHSRRVKPPIGADAAMNVVAQDF